ncbi:hypothetical protein GA0115243_10083 [Streptomyces sp. ScaeMP-e83]|nr:hypothetical protein GA0115243_10083 [Streptomyces sp. ScaeMP-e83]
MRGRWWGRVRGWGRTHMRGGYRHLTGPVGERVRVIHPKITYRAYAATAVIRAPRMCRYLRPLMTPSGHAYSFDQARRMSAHACEMSNWAGA